MKKIVTAAATVAIAVLGISSASADDFAFSKEIVARQGMLQLAGFNLGILAAMAKGERPYDAKLAALSAKNVHLVSMVDQSALWPQGSDNANPELKGKTGAKPGLWSNMPDVQKKHAAWEEAAGKLAKVAGDGLDALKPAVGEVGKSCKSCHDDYRAKR